MNKLIYCLIVILGINQAHSQIVKPNKLTNSDKVYGLSKFWQEVNYNFVYLDKVNRTQWDSLYYSLIEKVQDTKDDYEYWKLMQKFCAFLNDGHTGVWSTDSTINNNYLTKMFGDYWIGFTNVDGHAIVNYTLKKYLKEIPIGSELIEVNGLSTSKYLKENVLPYISSSTEYVKEDYAISNIIAGLKGASYDIKLKKPDGKIYSLHLTHERTVDTAYYPAIVDKPLLELKWYPNDVAYLSLNSFSDPKIDTLFREKITELRKAKSLIIDLRYNGGGSTGIGTYILQYLINDTIMNFSHTYTRENLASFKAWGKYTTVKDTIDNEWRKKTWLAYHDLLMYDMGFNQNSFQHDLSPIVIPTVILTGHNTASAAEDFLISADGQKHFTKIGERTYGSTGQPLMLDLPGGGARICTKKDTYPDGREFVGVGIIPDIEVKPTVNDFIIGNDPVLTKALNYLKSYKN